MRMKRFPMMLQLVLILFCVMIIPTSMMTWYSGAQILGYSENAIAESSLNSLTANQELNENALNYIAQDTVRLASTNIFDGIRHYQSYEQLNADYTRVETGLSLLKELQRLTRSNEGVYSAFFYLNDADYIIASDKGIIPLDRYESLQWIDEALIEKDGIAGIWYPRFMESRKMVLSYVLPLNRLSTSTKGMLVINMNEEQVAYHMNGSEHENNHYLIINKDDNTVISHDNKELLLSEAQTIPIVENVLKQNTPSGYSFHEQNGERLLYTWHTSTPYNWLYVNSYSMDTLMSQTRSVQESILVFTIIVVIAGSILAVALATWLSKPIRSLVRQLKARDGSCNTAANELAFLDTAFRRMQDEEDKLKYLIKEHEQDACSLIIHHLLKGDTLDRKKSELLQEMFPEKYFYVAVIAIDQYSKYLNKTSPEARSYHQYSLMTNAINQQIEGLYIHSVNYGEGRMGIIINVSEENKQKESLLITCLEQISAKAKDVFGHSVTIGVSSMAQSTSHISSQWLEAIGLIKHRMIQGNGRILFWRQEEQSNLKYIYPVNSERRILNYLDTGDMESISLEFEVIRKQIVHAANISYDNIIFIYNQLVGATIKHLNEKNINTSAIFASQGNIYSDIASIDTLDELEGYLKQFYMAVIPYVDHSGQDVNYIEKIFEYLDAHYSEEIVFEEMAKEIGISYSYMRKLVYEVTGKSLIECINQKRIQKAKQLLVKSTLNVAQIAAEVGYNNIQSFNRFFRKFEGITPSSYKASKLNR